MVPLGEAARVVVARSVGLVENKTRSKITSLWANELTSKDYVRLLPPLCFCPIFQEFWTKSKTRTRFVLLWNTAHVAARE